MRFDSPGYELKFIQRNRCTDDTDHLYSHIYKFYSPRTRYFYIVTADEHVHDTFAIKFYCKKDRRSEFKYSKSVNKGDVGNILITCLKLVPIILEERPNASFGFIGARSLDTESQKVESYVQTQRYNVYKEIVETKIGDRIFHHSPYPLISSYLLINKNCEDLIDKEALITEMFQKTYPNLVSV